MQHVHLQLHYRHHPTQAFTGLPPRGSLLPTLIGSTHHLCMKLIHVPTEESTNGGRPDDPASWSTALTHRNRKKPSPSTQRRNARWRESFLSSKKTGGNNPGSRSGDSQPSLLSNARPTVSTLRMYVLGPLLLETGTQSLNCLSALELSLSSREKHQV